MHLTMKSGNILRQKLHARLVTTAVLINMKTKRLRSRAFDRLHIYLAFNKLKMQIALSWMYIFVCGGK